MFSGLRRAEMRSMVYNTPSMGDCDWPTSDSGQAPWPKQWHLVQTGHILGVV